MNEVNRLKEDLQQAQLAYFMAAQISQFKTGFLARIAHEIRAPISSIMGLHQLILNNLCESPEEERDFINQAYQAHQRLLKIIDEIVKVSKIESGKIALRLMPFQLGMVLADLYQITHLLAANRNLKLEIILPESPIFVLADLEKFLQILITLVDTGITLTKEGTIKIFTQVNGDSKTATIYLNIPCSVLLWQENSQEFVTENSNLPLTIPEPTLKAVKSFSEKIEMSPTLKFLMAQALIESMQGHLEVLPMPEENQGENFTQIQCSVPLSSADFVVQG